MGSQIFLSESKATVWLTGAPEISNSRALRWNPFLTGPKMNLFKLMLLLYVFKMKDDTVVTVMDNWLIIQESTS